jgi:hypothetical protein
MAGGLDPPPETAAVVDRAASAGRTALVDGPDAPGGTVVVDGPDAASGTVVVEGSDPSDDRSDLAPGPSLGDQSPTAHCMKPPAPAATETVVAATTIDRRIHAGPRVDATARPPLSP